jgi:hypothetical protein
MPEIHPGRLRVSFREDRSFMKRVRNGVRLSRMPAHGEKVPGAPQVRSLERDLVPGSTPRIAEGELVELTGGGLSFDSADSEEGVFLIPLEGTGEIRVGIYGHVGTNKVLFKAPAAPSGRYHLSVRTRPTRADVRQGARTAVEY